VIGTISVLYSSVSKVILPSLSQTVARHSMIGRIR
jgi:hypothetical protein